MKKDFIVCPTTIDQVLYELMEASFRHSEAAGRINHWSVVDALRWYIYTGRASVDWIKALAKANPDKLILRLQKAEHTELDISKACTDYLVKHCGFQIDY